MDLTYYTPGGSGDGGDQYTGLDRFGRVIDQRWENGGGDVERVEYGYDETGNQVWRQNVVAGTGQDQYYTQDGLSQLKVLQRGTLNGSKTGIVGTPKWEEDWNFDPLGNWHGSSSAYMTKVNGTTTLDQNRTHSKVNKITAISTSAGTAWPTPPGYDGNGNMNTRVPMPLSPTVGFDLTYDAWNRLVDVKFGGTSLVLASYQYDGSNRRVTKTANGNTRHYYYDDQWRVVEERLNASTNANRRYVWGIRRLDDLILRDRQPSGSLRRLEGLMVRERLPLVSVLRSGEASYSGGGGSGSGSGSGGSASGSGSGGRSGSSSGGPAPEPERLYAVDDGKNVTAVVDVSGDVQERYGYNGFGGVNYMDGSFNPLTRSSFDWETLFDSYRYDTETGFYQVRFRYLHPLLGRLMTRDPIGEAGGINLYEFNRNSPINYIDPTGRAPQLTSVTYDPATGQASAGYSPSDGSIVVALGAAGLGTASTLSWAAYVDSQTAALNNLQNIQARLSFMRDYLSLLRNGQAYDHLACPVQATVNSLTADEAAAAAGVPASLGSMDATAVLLGEAGGLGAAAAWTGIPAAFLAGYTIGSAINALPDSTWTPFRLGTLIAF